MAVTTIVPNADDSGWDTGTWDDVNEGVPGDDDTTKVVEATRNTEMTFDLTSPGLADADTITNVSVDIRARSDKAASSSNLGVEIHVGGTIQGAQQVVSLTSSWATTTGINDAAWNTDWTAAQLDGMQVLIDTTQTGMPTADVWEVTAIDVIITYTPAASGHPRAMRHHMKQMAGH